MKRKGGRPPKGNDNRITVRLSDVHLDTLAMYALINELSDKTTSEAIRSIIDAEAIRQLHGDHECGIDVEEARQHLNELRHINTTGDLVLEIQEARRILSDATWKNVAYNPELYKTPSEKKKVADALKESADIIHDLFYSLAKRIESED